MWVGTRRPRWATDAHYRSLAEAGGDVRAANDRVRLVLGGVVDRITAAVAVRVVGISAVPLTADALMIPAPDATVAASLAPIGGVLVLASLIRDEHRARSR